MTVMSIYAPVTRMGNGATVIFDFPYQFFAPSDLVVSLWDLTANAPVAPPPVLNGAGALDYTVTGTVDTLGTGEYLNGQVHFHAPPSSNVQVTIARHIAAVQPVALADDSLFPAKTVEAEFDRLQMQIHENGSGLQRAITAPASDPAVDLELAPANLRAGMMLSFDASGNVETDIEAAEVEAALAVFLSGGMPASSVAGWAPNLAAAKALYPASAVLADGQVVTVACRASVNDGYAGAFVYKAGDSTTTFVGDGIGFVDNQGRRFFRVFDGELYADWFGASITASGAVNLSAWTSAIAACRTRGGGWLVGNHAGSYVVAAPGIVNPYISGDVNGADGRVRIRGRFKAGADNMTIYRHSDNWSEFIVDVDANFHTGVTGVRLAPENEAQTTAVVNQNFNYGRMRALACDEALVLKPGPSVAGTQSGCWYNVVHVHAVNCKRAVLLDDAVTVNGSGSNRNVFYLVVNNFGAAVNTGVSILNGLDNCFLPGTSFEGVNGGSVPYTVPAAIRVQRQSAGGADNTGNMFFGTMFEANNVDISNGAPWTEFYGQHALGSKLVFNEIPSVLLGGFASETPIVFPGFTWQTNNQLPGVNNLEATIPGSVKTSGLVSRLHGTATGIANNATFQIVVPVSNKAWSLKISTNGNFTNPHRSFFGTDGVSPVTPHVESAGQMALSIVGNTVTVTNQLGATCNFWWALTQETE